MFGPDRARRTPSCHESTSPAGATFATRRNAFRATSCLANTITTSCEPYFGRFGDTVRQRPQGGFESARRVEDAEATTGFDAELQNQRFSGVPDHDVLFTLTSNNHQRQAGRPAKLPLKRTHDPLDDHQRRARRRGARLSEGAPRASHRRARLAHSDRQGVARRRAARHRRRRSLRHRAAGGTSTGSARQHHGRRRRRSLRGRRGGRGLRARRTRARARAALGRDAVGRRRDVRLAHFSALAARR